MLGQGLSIKLIAGKQGPIYKDRKELKILEAVITEQATESNLPIVDLVMEDDAGNKYLGVLTGRIVNAMSGAVKGVNQRNHGNPEP